MPHSNVEIHRLGWLAIVAIFALLGFGQVSGSAGILIAFPASAVLLVALRKLRARHPDNGLRSGRK